MTVSFIIPTFNSHAYIGRCLESIFVLEKDLPDFEVIVIDDASTDDTVDIVSRFVSNHNCIKLLCQNENHRQGAARNLGLSMAQGDIIIFVDSDDELAPGILSAIRIAERNEIELVAIRVERVLESGDLKIESLPYSKREFFSGIELQSDYPFWIVAIWAYVYKRSFLQVVNYPFAEDVFYEDSDFVSVHLFHAKRMAYSDECGYIAHYNASSTTHTVSYKHLADYAYLGTRMLSFYESQDNKASRYAKSILEGGSFNVMKAFSKLYRLKSHNDVRAFYDRLDAKYNRKQLLGYTEPEYCWTRWTRFCLKHRELAIALMALVIPLARIMKKASFR